MGRPRDRGLVQLMRPLIVFVALLLCIPTLMALATGTPPTFTNYSPASGGASAGEPSIGANWLSGAVLTQAGSQTFSTTFDSQTPAVATWTKRYDVGGEVGTGGLDPIL